MGTRIEDTGGNLLWAPNDFGKYSLDKIQTVSDILSGMLTDITITVKSDSESLKNTYTKEEILKLLETYMLKSDFEEMAGQAVKDKTDVYIKGLQDEGKIVTTDTTNAIDSNLTDVRKAVNYLTMLCFDSTLASVIGWNTEPSIQALPPRLDNIDTQIIDISSKVDRVVGDVYIDAHLREGFKFATTQELDALDKRVVAIESADTGVQGQIQDIESDITGLNNDLAQATQSISNLSTKVQSLEQSKSTQDTKNQGFETSIDELSDSIGDLSIVDSALDSASLVGALNSLTGLVSTLSQKLQALEDKVTQLENNP